MLYGTVALATPVLLVDNAIQKLPAEPEARLVADLRTGEGIRGGGFWFVEEGRVMAGVEVVGVGGPQSTRRRPARFWKIVPLASGAPAGMVAWEAGVEEADRLGGEIGALPAWRDVFHHLADAGDVAARELARAVWILGTRPSVIAIADGRPRQSGLHYWRWHHLPSMPHGYERPGEDWRVLAGAGAVRVRGSAARARRGHRV